MDLAGDCWGSWYYLARVAKSSTISAMVDWIKAQWDDIKRNVKYALLLIVLGAIVTGAAVLVRGLPVWKDAILVFLFLLLAFWGAVATLWRKFARQETKREFEQLADEDSGEMSKRLVLCGTSAKLHLEPVEPYIDVSFKVVNASMFILMSDKVEGNAFYYRGYSGEKCQLSRTPIIVDSLNVFTLPRAVPKELTLRQFVPLEITDDIAANNDSLKVDFSEVRVYFLFPGTSGHKRFCWFGGEVEVSGLSVPNETLSRLGIVPNLRQLMVPSDKALLSTLQEDALQLSVELLNFLKRLGPPPAPKYTAEDIGKMNSSQTDALVRAEDGDFAEACEYHFGDGTRFRQTAQGLENQMTARWKRLLPWYQKVGASYALEFKAKVENLRNRFLVEGITDDVLLLPIEGRDGEKHIRAIAAKLWGLAYKIGEKRISSEDDRIPGRPRRIEGL